MPLADRAIRLAMTLAVLVLAAVSFFVSWRHTYNLALTLGEDHTTARAVPMTVDLMLVAAALTGLFCSRYALPQPRLARFALLLGISATITVNVADGIGRGVWAAVFDGWPAVALVVSSELLLWVVAAGRSMDRKTIVTVEEVTDEAREQLARAVSLVGAEPTISGAELGRRMQVRYPVALSLLKQAQAKLNG